MTRRARILRKCAKLNFTFARQQRYMGVYDILMIVNNTEVYVDFFIRQVTVHNLWPIRQK